MSLTVDHLRPTLSTQLRKIVPARMVLQRAEQQRHDLGHENQGFLSERRGFMPFDEPLRQLPPEFAAWDEAAARMPELYRTLRLRRELDSLPLLDAGPAALPDRYLLRAVLVLGFLAQSYWYVETRTPQRLPAALELPLAQIRARLGRTQAAVSFVDAMYNWRLLDRSQPDRIAVDNLEMLVPTVDTRAEHVFYLTAVEIGAAGIPMVPAMVRAHEAITRDDPDELHRELLVLLEGLDRMRPALDNINPHPDAVTHVDPVLWARTVAPLVVPITPGQQGPSGTASPIFSALDAFLGRTRFETYLGREMQHLRKVFPPMWQDYLVAIGAISVTDYVARTGDRGLDELLREVVEAYTGKNGFLGRHRMKVRGYLELAFKVGRRETITGFQGMFADRTWEVIDNELELARLERPELPKSCHRVGVKQVISYPDGLTDVVLDASGVPPYFRAGDHCCVLPENSDTTVGLTLTAIGATGDELVAVTPQWRALAELRGTELQWAKLQWAGTLTVREVLRYGHLRPVSAETAQALSNIARLPAPLPGGGELWELLLALRGQGFETERLWRDPDLLCTVVQPAAPRPYSISSAPGGPELRLTVSHLRYGPYEGTASSFLAGADGRTEPIYVSIERSPRFNPPDDPATPLVMIAGGSGIAPFRGFVAERLRTPGAGPAWLLLGLRSSGIEHAADLDAARRAGLLRLDVAYSRPATGPARRIGDLLTEPDTARRLRELLRPAAQGGTAQVYVCGSQGFARSAMTALREVLDGAGAGTGASLIARLVGEGRLELEAFSGHDPDRQLPEFGWSEIALHNDERRGLWIAIDDRVYDIAEFIRRHPGGARILRGWAGTDASRAYYGSHHGRADVDAMRELHAVGAVRRLDLPTDTVPLARPDRVVEVSAATVHRAWAGALHLVVEMQNALVHDHLLPRLTTTRDDPDPPRAAYNLQLAIESHERFVSSYLDVLLDETFENLWALTRARFAPEFDETWLRGRLAAVRQSDDSRWLATVLPRLYRELDDLVARRADVDALIPTCAALADCDRELLAELKEIIRGGVATFEDLGPQVTQHGAPRLVAAYERLPTVVAEYHTRLRHRLTEAATG